MSNKSIVRDMRRRNAQQTRLFKGCFCANPFEARHRSPNGNVREEDVCQCKRIPNIQNHLGHDNKFQAAVQERLFVQCGQPETHVLSTSRLLIYPVKRREGGSLPASCILLLKDGCEGADVRCGAVQPNT